MEIDLDAERAALEPFVLTVGGDRFVGRPLSWPGYERVCRAAELVGKDPQLFETTLRDAFRAVFPFEWKYFGRPRRDPVWRIMQEGPALRQRLVQRFFDWAASWKQDLPTRPTTSGPSDSAPSSEAPTL